MTDQISEHRAVVTGCVLAARMLRQYDLPAALEAIDKAETLGPILDPTLFRDKSRAMREDKEIIHAALSFWRFAEKLELQDE